MKPDKDSFFLGFILGLIVMALCMTSVFFLVVPEKYMKDLTRAEQQGRAKAIIYYLRGRQNGQ